MDFGIARAIADTAATMTQTQSVVGTAQYLSPEQAQGQTVDARSDLYSTGCLLFELLAGRPPFTGDSPVAIAYQHVGELPQPPSVFNDAVGGDLDAVTLHALAKDREARYQNATAFRADLENVRLGRPDQRGRPGHRGRRRRRRHADPPAGVCRRRHPDAPCSRPSPRAASATPNTAGLPAVGHDEGDGDETKGGRGKAALITGARHCRAGPRRLGCRDVVRQPDAGGDHGVRAHDRGHEGRRRGPDARHQQPPGREVDRGQHAP